VVAVVEDSNQLSQLGVAAVGSNIHLAAAAEGAGRGLVELEGICPCCLREAERTEEDYWS